MRGMVLYWMSSLVWCSRWHYSKYSLTLSVLLLLHSNFTNYQYLVLRQKRLWFVCFLRIYLPLLTQMDHTDHYLLYNWLLDPALRWKHSVSHFVSLRLPAVFIWFLLDSNSNDSNFLITVVWLHLAVAANHVSDTKANTASYTTQRYTVGSVMLITWDVLPHNPVGFWCSAELGVNTSKRLAYLWGGSDA